MIGEGNVIKHGSSFDRSLGVPGSQVDTLHVFLVAAVIPVQQAEEEVHRVSAVFEADGNYDSDLIGDLDGRVHIVLGQELIPGFCVIYRDFRLTLNKYVLIPPQDKCVTELLDCPNQPGVRHNVFVSNFVSDSQGCSNGLAGERLSPEALQSSPSGRRSCCYSDCRSRGGKVPVVCGMQVSCMIPSSS